MTDNEIKISLELFISELDKKISSDKIMIVNEEGMRNLLKITANSLAVINRQQAEIERLRYNLECVLKERADHSDAIEEFAERFLKIVHDNHYVLVDRINSKDYGMFTIGIEQAVDETKKEMVGDDK